VHVGTLTAGFGSCEMNLGNSRWTIDNTVTLNGIRVNQDSPSSVLALRAGGTLSSITGTLTDGEWHADGDLTASSMFSGTFSSAHTVVLTDVNAAQSLNVPELANLRAPAGAGTVTVNTSITISGVFEADRSIDIGGGTVDTNYLVPGAGFSTNDTGGWNYNNCLGPYTNLCP